MQKQFNPKSSYWRTWLLVLLLTAGTIRTSAQSGFDRLVASAENGDADAQVKLGILYYEGMADSPRPDYAEAMKWFQRAADQGDAEAQDRIGLMYYLGKGVPKDYAEAARWYQLAADRGNYHARLQLSDMYARGVGVPRDRDESRKWARLASALHPDKQTPRIRAWFGVAVLALVGFSIGLAALQRNALTGWPHLVVAVLVHATGIMLLLDTLTTYGFWIVFPHCSHNFLATACTQISDQHTRMIVNEFGDWAMVNLVFRFMAGVGLVVDALAVWYVVYLCRLLFRGPRVAIPRAAPAR
jgi:tetratricopeptide (TPR) repeat protein